MTYDELNAYNDARMQQFHDRHKALELFKVESGVAVIIRKSPFNGKSYETHLTEAFALDEGTITLPQEKSRLETAANWLTLIVGGYLIGTCSFDGDVAMWLCGAVLMVNATWNLRRD